MTRAGADDHLAEMAPRIQSESSVPIPGRQIAVDSRQLKRDVAVLILFAIITLVLESSLLSPFQRGWFRDDESIALPHKNNSVPAWAAGLIGLAVPLVAIGATHALWTPYWPRATVVRALVVFLFGAALCLFTTDVVKMSVGRLRPDFLARCQPDYSRLPAGTSPTAFVSDGSVCTGDAAEITEGRKSFPSGHSSFSMYGMSFAIVWLQRYCRASSLSFTLLPLLQLACLTAALLIGISRVRDHWHHPWDVLSGFLVGIASTAVTFYSHALPAQLPPVRFKFAREAALAASSGGGSSSGGGGGGGGDGTAQQRGAAGGGDANLEIV